MNRNTQPRMRRTRAATSCGIFSFFSFFFFSAAGLTGAVFVCFGTLLWYALKFVALCLF